MRATRSLNGGNGVIACDSWRKPLSENATMIKYGRMSIFRDALAAIF